MNNDPDPNAFYGANKCIDGSRTTNCKSAQSYGADNWLSVRVEGNGIGFVSIYLYRAGPGNRLAPYEIWVGSAYGDMDSTRGAMSCSSILGDVGPLLQRQSPTLTRMPTSGSPVIVACAPNKASYITLLHKGREPLSVSELVAYPPAPINASTSRIRQRSYDVVAEINHRYERGKPSTHLAEAGVLIHMFDQAEDWHGGQPWDMCNTDCGKSVDHFSCSIISARKPAVYGGDGASAGGLLLAADTEILCAWDHDIGSGNQANGGCPKSWSSDQLLDVLKACDSDECYWYNEVVVGHLYWERSLPDAIDAFVFTEGDGAKARDAHSKFLSFFSLCSSDVPLLHYTGKTFVDASPPPSAACRIPPPVPPPPLPPPAQRPVTIPVPVPKLPLPTTTLPQVLSPPLNSGKSFDEQKPPTDQESTELVSSAEISTPGTLASAVEALEEATRLVPVATSAGGIGPPTLVMPSEPPTSSQESLATLTPQTMLELPQARFTDGNDFANAVVVGATLAGILTTLCFVAANCLCSSRRSEQADLEEGRLLNGGRRSHGRRPDRRPEKTSAGHSRRSMRFGR